MRFCIDPGHGGKDPGALGRHHKEEDFNLAIGLELRKILLAKGHKVIMTRDKDVFVSLNSRCAIANNYKADRFISIHCNAAGSPKAGGAEVCYITAQALAKKMSADLARLLHITNRGCKLRKDIAVLKGTDMMAVLAEIAFITNPIEEEILHDNVHAIANVLAYDLITVK